jgi:hypothetical protein
MMLFKLRCHHCGYCYGLKLLEPYPFEFCPICGHCDVFEVFCPDYSKNLAPGYKNKPVAEETRDILPAGVGMER